MYQALCTIIMYNVLATTYMHIISIAISWKSLQMQCKFQFPNMYKKKPLYRNPTYRETWTITFFCHFIMYFAHNVWILYIDTVHNLCTYKYVFRWVPEKEKTSFAKKLFCFVFYTFVFDIKIWTKMWQIPRHTIIQIWTQLCHLTNAYLHCIPNLI